MLQALVANWHEGWTPDREDLANLTDLAHGAIDDAEYGPPPSPGRRAGQNLPVSGWAAGLTATAVGIVCRPSHRPPEFADPVFHPSSPPGRAGYCGITSAKVIARYPGSPFGILGDPERTLAPPTCRPGHR